MPLFDFALRNTAPTLVANPDPRWFWLTDGNYNICINGKRLLSYNPATLTANERAQWKQQAVCTHTNQNIMSFACMKTCWQKPCRTHGTT